MELCWVILVNVLYLIRRAFIRFEIMELIRCAAPLNNSVRFQVLINNRSILARMAEVASREG